MCGICSSSPGDPPCPQTYWFSCPLSELPTSLSHSCGMGTLITAHVRFASLSSGLRLILSLKYLIISKAGYQCSCWYSFLL